MFLGGPKRALEYYTSKVTIRPMYNNNNNVDEYQSQATASYSLPVHLHRVSRVRAPLPIVTGIANQNYRRKSLKRQNHPTSLNLTNIIDDPVTN